MPNASIAGPRRARAAALPAPEPSVVVPPGADGRPAAAQARRSDIPTLPQHPATRPLPPLDYDEPARGASRSSLMSTQPGKRGMSRSLRWLVLGIAVGAVGGMLASGDPHATWRSVRFWGADILRSLERNPRPAAPVGSYSTSRASAPREPVAKRSAPCPVDPGAGDPCAELLAPFAADPWAAKGASPPLALNVPTVSIDDLPRAKPVRVAVIERPRRPAKIDDREAAPRDESGGDGTSSDATDSTSGNPYADDPQTSPTRSATPSSGGAGSDSAPSDTPAPTSEQPSARNEAP